MANVFDNDNDTSTWQNIRGNSSENEDSDVVPQSPIIFSLVFVYLIMIRSFVHVLCIFLVLAEISSLRFISPISTRSGSSFKLNSDVLLNEPVETTKAKISLKIAVAGAGIGGMFLGYTLQSKGFDVTVFEKSAK